MEKAGKPAKKIEGKITESKLLLHRKQNYKITS